MQTKCKNGRENAFEQVMPEKLIKLVYVTANIYTTTMSVHLKYVEVLK